MIARRLTSRRILGVAPGLIIQALIAIAWLMSLFPAVAQPRLVATVNRPVITLGETVTLSLTSDTRLGQGPQLPPIPGFTVVGRGSSVQINNGQVQQSFTFELSPTQEGDLTIPALRFSMAGQSLSTQPIAVKVLRPGQSTPGGGPPPHFAKIFLPGTQAYVGEVLEIEVQVYFQEGRLRQFPQLPADAGFTMGKWLQPTETRVALSNQAFGLVTFKVPITPVKTGLLALGPATLPLFVPDRNRRADFFFGQPEREVRLIADEIKVPVRALPTNNVPPTFAGAVGEFTIAVTASPRTVAVGDPITARVQVNGRGWLDALTLPPQPAWGDFKLYPPTARVEARDQNNIVGVKTFEVAVVPQHPGIKEIPPFSFSFFHPDQHEYRTVSSAAIPITVTPAAASSAPLPTLATGTNGNPAAPDETAQIRVRLGTVTAGPLLVTRPWFMFLPLVAPLLWAVLLFRRKRSEALASNPRARRKREVEKFVREGLARLREHAAGNRSVEFYGTLFRLLQEQMGERANLPASAVTESVIEERLRPAGLPDRAAATLHELFQACNVARFAPTHSTQELTALIPRVETVLRELQQCPLSK